MQLQLSIHCKSFIWTAPTTLYHVNLEVSLKISINKSRFKSDRSQLRNMEGFVKKMIVSTEIIFSNLPSQIMKKN